MSDIKVATTEPDPSATSIPNDQTVMKEAGDSSEPTVKDIDMAESKPANGEAEVKEEASVKEDTDAKKDVKEEADEKKDVKQDKRRYDENGVLKTSAQVDWKDHRKNSKYDPSILPTTDDPAKIRAQVEFYFSDTNMPTDDYMLDLTQGPENLPVSISKICAFGRMKRFQPQSAVVTALRESKFLVVEGPEGMEQIKRKVAWDPTTPKNKSESRSIYAKGFGDEEPGSQFDIEAFFAPYGPTNSVRLRRTDQKLFKGSVFVEFQDDETAEKFLKLDPKPLWKGNALLIKSKRDYMNEKEEEIKSGKIEPKEQRNFKGGRGGRGRGRGGDRRGNDRRENRGDRDQDDWKKRREEDRASGFRDNRKDNRGRGRDRDNKRGGRGDRRDNRGGNDRNREREDKEKAESKDVKSEDAPVKSEDSPNQKRPREDENGTGESAAKKVDTKSDEPSSNGNKRAREDDTSEGNAAKKVDTKSES
ncbi:related to RNA-binding protein La1 [Rhynchosporium graminicola]|uniref:Related to RNA-binding protein La1 n=1 Tax=Rhynchosporium graminicola TaxID=2792576 RepID=A0A1E1KR91_9HELO|nr:related to RNA-binding protein La1 [Rhynchosporium commune]